MIECKRIIRVETELYYPSCIIGEKIVNIFLGVFYFIIMIMNMCYCFKNRESKILSTTTFILLFILMCGHHYVGNGDSTDLYYYWRDYNDVFSGKQDEILYFLFYFTQSIAKFFMLTYYQWWAVMTAVSLYLVSKIIRAFSLNSHYCLLFFSFYVLALYTGLKYYYGFCLFLLALNYFIRDRRGDNLRFIACILLAGAMHAMYYLFLLFLFAKNKIVKPFNLMVIMSLLLLFTVFVDRNLLLGMLSPILLIVSAEINVTRDIYFLDSTNYGFIIPLVLHVVTLVYSLVYYKLSLSQKNISIQAEAKMLYEFNVMGCILYPLFFYAVTFTRYITVMALASVFISGKGFKLFSRKKKVELMMCGLVLSIFFSLYFFGPCNYLEYNVIPLFDNFYLENI